ncbi:MAG: hypothetical protein LBP59_17055 [Planctomycetaceae bacterium]|nr:hypothetical protein [Planctomycetaceae bacterium]
MGHEGQMGQIEGSQDRRRFAYMRLYSTADDRGYISTDFFVCLSANCRRDGCVLSQFFVTKKLSLLSHLSLLSLKNCQLRNLLNEFSRTITKKFFWRSIKFVR